ncbi:MAG: Zn-ribbon domain-containing OB-fold protein [Thermoplasmata archaeon]
MMPRIELPYLLDFFPLQDEDFTRIYPFFENLKHGRLTTTKCKKCGEVHWQPRIVCPHCSGDEIEWIDIPREGKLFAFTEIIHGAPLGMEEDVPFSVGIVELENPPLRIVARIDGAKYEDLEIGQMMELRIVNLEDGRVWFRWVPKE